MEKPPVERILNYLSSSDDLGRAKTVAQSIKVKENWRGAESLPLTNSTNSNIWKGYLDKVSKLGEDVGNVAIKLPNEKSVHRSMEIMEWGAIANMSKS